MNNNQLNNNLQQPNYLICTLHGFKDFLLYDNKPYIVNNELIKSIYIDNDLKQMKVELQKDITYTGNEKQIENYLYHLCFNLIVKTEVCYSLPVYTIDVIFENNKDMVVKDSLNLNDTIEIIRSYQGDYVYNLITKSPTSIEENFMKYERIFKTLHNPNIIVQFMSLYQFLMELLQGNKPHPSQKSVTKYLKANKHKYSFLSFKPTRKQGESYNEDCFTYIRNEIGHCEETNDLNLYKQLGNQITQQLIKNLIIVLNDIILDN